MANELNFTQLATILTEVHRQATGQSAIAVLNTGDFVTVAQATLNTGYDNCINAISQVLSRTIFSVRPYNRKFRGLNVTEQQYGNHVRKLSIIDKAAENDNRHNLVDGQSIDQQKVNKPNILQTNFYGQNVYQRSVTLFKDQLDTAFSGPQEFGAFVAMVMQNVSDLIEKDHEECARATIANFIGGKLCGEASNSEKDGVIHLVTEYNAATGLELTAETVKRPENFSGFIKWAMARIRKVSDLMTERTAKFHTNINGKPVSRHTPYDKQKVYINTSDIRDMETMVLSTIYHDDYLKKVDFETVNYWQNIDKPTGISVNATYLSTSGSLDTVEQSRDYVFGVIFDADAVGYTTVNQWTASAPFNASGGYTNTFWHFTNRYWNDFTENGVVFLLD